MNLFRSLNGPLQRTESDKVLGRERRIGVLNQVLGAAYFWVSGRPLNGAARHQ